MMTSFSNLSLTLDSYFEKIFYINLNKDVDRNDNIIKQFREFGITNYERIEAVELKQIPSKEKYRNFIKNDHKYILGQLSCRASHVKCMQIAKERKYSRILILEDDVIMYDNPNKLLATNSKMLTDWDMLYFGGLIEQLHNRNYIVCTHAYAVRSTLYDDIILMADCSGMEIDLFYAKVVQQMGYSLNQSGKYNINVIFPFNIIAQNKSFKSNIQSS